MKTNELYVFDLDGKIIEKYKSASEYARVMLVTSSSIFNYIYSGRVYRGKYFLSFDKFFVPDASVNSINNKFSSFYIYTKIHGKISLSYVASSKASCSDYIQECTGRYIDDITPYLNNDRFIDNTYCIHTTNKYELNKLEKAIMLEYHMNNE